MKTRVTLVVAIAALAIGIVIGRLGGPGSLNGEEAGKPATGPGAEAPSAPTAEIQRERLLPGAAAAYLHVDLPRLAAQRDRFGLWELFRRPETAEVLAAFFAASSPAFLNAVTETVRYAGSELEVALAPRNLDSGEGPVQLLLAGRTKDPTPTLDAWLRVGLAPFLAGGNVSAATEDVMGLPLVGATGPKGGLFWTFRGEEFLAAREKSVLADVLKASGPPRESTGEVPSATAAPPWGSDPFVLHVDLDKARKSGVIPKSPDPKAPVLLSALALAAERGFVTLDVAGGYEGSVLRLSMKLTHREDLPPWWRTMGVGPGVYAGLPAETLAAVAVGFGASAAPVGGERGPASGGPAEVEEATPVPARFLARVLPEQSAVLKPMFAGSPGAAVVGACPVGAAGKGPAYFVALPYPGDEAVEQILEWARGVGAGVESVAFGGLTLFDLDFGGEPPLGASDLARLVLAQVGDRLAVATHPEVLSKLDTGADTAHLGEGEEYAPLRSLLLPRAAIRAYVAPELLRMVLDGHRGRLDWTSPGTADVDALLNLAGTFSAPIYLSVGAEGRTLEVQILSPSDVAAMVGAGILQHAATALLIEE